MGETRDREVGSFDVLSLLPQGNLALLMHGWFDLEYVSPFLEVKTKISGEDMRQDDGAQWEKKKIPLKTVPNRCVVRRRKIP